MLPVNDAGEPDYGYMERYVRNMMLRKYKQYLAFLGSPRRPDSSQDGVAPVGIGEDADLGGDDGDDTRNLIR